MFKKMNFGQLSKRTSRRQRRPSRWVDRNRKCPNLSNEFSLDSANVRVQKTKDLSEPFRSMEDNEAWNVFYYRILVTSN